MIVGKGADRRVPDCRLGSVVNGTMSGGQGIAVGQLWRCERVFDCADK